jgi:hypothetical protein
MLKEYITILTILGLVILVLRLFIDTSTEYGYEKRRVRILIDKIMMYVGLSFVAFGILMYSFGCLQLSSNNPGIILLLVGYGYIVAGVLLSPIKSRPKGDWTSKQYKIRLIIAGAGMVIVGFIMLIF